MTMQMADTSGLITIREVVNGFMMKSNMDREYPVLYQLACDCIRDLNLFILKDGKQVVKLNMNANLIVDLPDDYLNFLALAIPLKGKYWTLTRDDGIITTTTEQNGAEVLDSSYGEGVDINAQGFTSYSSTLSNLEGYYTLDERQRRIVFRNVDRSEVFLAYNSSGLRTDTEALVPVIAKRTIEDYMEYMITSYRNGSETKIERLRRRYDSERDKLIGLSMPTLYELRDAFNKVINQTFRK
jgi:hypothetical protein